MKIQVLLLILLPITISSAQQWKISVEEGLDTSAGLLPCYIVTTPTATYYLEKVGAGLSSLLDVDGNDWLSFNPEPGTGAAGEYRGFPNAIYKQDGSYFHPLNAGTDSSKTEIESVTSEKVIIIARSGNGAWEARWTFMPTHCTFTMTKMPDDYKYWILYEGTPGGQYDDSDWWMTSAKKRKRLLTTEHKGDIRGPEWIVFGDQKQIRSLFLYHHEDDTFKDRFYQMEKKMTVFGFGRSGMDNYLSSTPQRFSIGFLGSNNHKVISDKLRLLFE